MWDIISRAKVNVLSKRFNCPCGSLVIEVLKNNNSRLFFKLVTRRDNNCDTIRIKIVWLYTFCSSSGKLDRKAMHERPKIIIKLKIT